MGICRGAGVRRNPNDRRDLGVSTPQPVRVWTHGACNPHGGHGGWAFVVVDSGNARGEAGGERASSPRRMGLTAVIRALASLPDGAAAVVIVSSDPAIVAGAGPEFADDADLWTTLAAGLAVRPARVVAAPAQADPKSAAGFVQAWSAFAVDKVKAGGPFRAPIPRPNLQKFPGLAGSR